MAKAKDFEQRTYHTNGPKKTRQGKSPNTKLKPGQKKSRGQGDGRRR
jgi:hypothetical protein